MASLFAYTRAALSATRTRYVTAFSDRSRTRVVIRERALDFIDPIGMEGLERFCRPHVQRLAPRPEQTVVGNVLRQGMLEHCTSDRRLHSARREIPGVAAPTGRLRIGPGPSAQPHEQPVWHFTTGDGRCLQQPLGGLG